MIYDIEFNSAGSVSSSGVLEAARAAEESGFGTVWNGESNGRDPAALLPAVAAVTRRIKVGTAVLHIFARTPVEVGMYAATMDELSQGRFVLGLGVANETLAEWHGLHAGHPLRRMEEYVGIVKRVFAADRLEHQGEYYSSNKFRLEFKPPSSHLPLLLASLGPKMAQLAGRIADGVVINMADPDRIRYLAENVANGATRAGRNPGDLVVVAKVRVSLNDDIEAAKNALRKAVAFYSLAYHYRDMLADMGLKKEVRHLQETHLTSGFKAAAKSVTDEMLSRLPVVPATTMREAKAGLTRYAHCGASSVVVSYVPSTDKGSEETVRFVRSW